MDFILKGTSAMLPVYIQDISSVNAGGLTGLTATTANLKAYYHRDTAVAPVNVPLRAANVGVYLASGFVPVENNVAPGDYQFHAPTGMNGPGANYVTLTIYGADNMLPVKAKYFLVDALPGFVASGALSRSSFQPNPEVSIVPAFPANPMDVLNWMGGRSIQRTDTTVNPTGSGGQDIIYNQAGTPVGSSVYTDNGVVFTRNKYQ